MFNTATPNSLAINQTKNRWDLSVRVFHWISVLLLITTWLFVYLHHNADDKSHTYIMWHRSLGLLFLVWVVSRLLNRLRTRQQNPIAANTVIWQKYLASRVHFLLYVAMVGMPITGLLMTQYGGREISLFGLFNIPAFVDPNPQLKAEFHVLHTDFIWTMLWALSGLHILSALFNQFIKKNKLINRML